MQVCLNINSQNVNPSFKSKPIFSRLNFGLKVKTLERDTIELSKFKLRASQLYSQVCQKVANPTVEEISKIVDKFAEKFPREDVLAVMHTLTQYSNMQSVYELYEVLKQNNIESLRGFGSYNYYDLYRNDSDECRYKLPIGYLPGLSDVFGYFFDRCGGKCPLPQASYRATILDKRAVQVMQEYKDKAPIKLHQLINPQDKFIYIKNFEAGCNIFEDQGALEIKTKEALEKLAILKEKNEGVSTQKLLNFMFNKENRDAIDKLGIPYTVVEVNSKRKPTVESIVENLSQKIPTEKEVIDSLERFIKPLTQDDGLQLKYISDVKDKLTIYTFKTISEKLKALKGIIEKEVSQKGKDPNGILYFIPNYRKSYGLISYIYQKVNNIPEEKFIDIDIKALYGEKEKDSLKKNISSEHTVVILDDASVTGESLIFDLNFKQAHAPEIMYATIFSTPEARANLEVYKSPKLVSVDSQTVCSLDRQVARNGHFNKHTMLLFPYVAPDNNISVVKELVEKFYPAKGFVQEPWEY